MSGIAGLNFTEYNSQPKPVDHKQAETAGVPVKTEPFDLMAQIGPAYKLDGSLETKVEEGKNEAEIKKLKQTGQIECQTCKNRTYQDGSDDPGVSFKSPGNISPEASVAVVSSHENEHVVNEQASANKEGRRIVSQSVQIFMDICPECGKAYASGGVTKTMSASDNSKNTDNSAANNNNDIAANTEDKK